MWFELQIFWPLLYGDDLYMYIFNKAVNKTLQVYDVQESQQILKQFFFQT